MSISKRIKSFVKFDQLSRSTYSFLAHFNEPQAIKVRTNFSRNMQNEFYTPSHDEEYNLELALKMLHFSNKRKRWYK